MLRREVLVAQTPHRILEDQVPMSCLARQEAVVTISEQALSRSSNRRLMMLYFPESALSSCQLLEQGAMMIHQELSFSGQTFLRMTYNLNRQEQLPAAKLLWWERLPTVLPPARTFRLWEYTCRAISVLGALYVQTEVFEKLNPGALSIEESDMLLKLSDSNKPTPKFLAKLMSMSNELHPISLPAKTLAQENWHSFLFQKLISADDSACIICTRLAFKPMWLGILFCKRGLGGLSDVQSADGSDSRSIMNSSFSGNLERCLSNFIKASEKQTREEQLRETRFNADQKCVMMRTNCYGSN
ncbi:MAG: hypothetical protein NXY57DRAFT_1044125 [Lentinula lateritia]|nr:MAG: hypothetical protein NXY57DRAFT_1044125 [Lentinula lateritia]